MATKHYFAEKAEQTPMIYAYEHIGVPSHEGWLKVGYTTRDVETRVREQNLTGSIRYKIVLKRPAMRKDGSSFDDHLVYDILRRSHVRNPDGEWFVTDVRTVERAIASAADGNVTMTEHKYRFYHLNLKIEEAVKNGIIGNEDDN